MTLTDGQIWRNEECVAKIECEQTSYKAVLFQKERDRLRFCRVIESDMKDLFEFLNEKGYQPTNSFLVAQ